MRFAIRTLVASFAGRGGLRGALRVGVVACALFVLGAAPASAVVVHPVLSSFDGSGSTAGEFTNLNRLAVSHTSGNVFVLDLGREVLDQFDASGSPVALSDPALMGASSIPVGSSLADADVTVDNSGTASDGNVYVAMESSLSEGVVHGFDSTGATLLGFPKTLPGDICGVGVDPEGDVWVAEFNSGLQEYDSSGVPLSGAFSRVGYCKFAFDVAGNLYVMRPNGSPEKYNPDGSGGFVADPVTPLIGDTDGGRAVAVHPISGHVYVASPQSVREYDSSGAFVSSWGSGTLSDAYGLGVDSATGNLYVSDAANGGVVYIFGTAFVPVVVTGAVTNVSSTSATFNGTVDPDGEQVTDCHFDYGPTASYGQSAPCEQAVGSGDGAVAVSAEVADLEIGYHFRLSASNANGTATGADQRFGPQIQGTSATALAKTTATLQTEVDPGGVAATCEFEYVSEADYDASAPNPYSAGQTAPCTPADLGAGSGFVPASADLTGLQPATTYHFRVVVTNAAGALSSTDHEFLTDLAARISGLRADVGSQTSADVSAEINPLGEETSYYFEYGTTTAYGTQVPVSAVSVGSGVGDVPVSARFEGLSPNTTYHWRVVATNPSGTTTSRDHTFIYDTGGSPLPDNRAYEQVTPVDKNASAFDRGFTFIAPPVASGDGNRVTVNPIQCFAEAEACVASYLSFQGSLYALERSPAGWRPRQLSPPATQYEGTSVRSTEADTGQALFAGRRSADVPIELVARLADGGVRSIGAVTPSVVTDPFVPTARASADLSRVVFGDTSAALDWPFDQTFKANNTPTILEYVAGAAEPILVGVSGGAGSTDLIGECGTRLNDLSRDGRTVIVTVIGEGNGCSQPAPAADEIYARIDESVTVKISGRSSAGCTSPQCQSSSAAPAVFAAASTDARRIVFRSTQQLTDDATDGSDNLYLYDFDKPAGARLTTISVAAVGEPGLDGVTAVNEAGTHVYFAARGALASEPNAANEDPEPGDHNLYLYERDAAHPGGRLVFITELSGDDATIWTGSGNRVATVTPDGRHLMLLSRSDLTDDGADSKATEVYRYNAQTGEMTRLSVGERGFNGNGDETGPQCDDPGLHICPADALIATGSSGTKGLRSISDDGRFAFFSSPAALTPGATDYEPSGPVDPNTGAKYYRHNLYEWHDGHVYLIADGDALPPFNRDFLSPVVGTDATGSNVFFKSQASLSGTDTDNGQLDIYTARVCTEADPCIKSPVRATACSGDQCQGALAVSWVDFGMVE